MSGLLKPQTVELREKLRELRKDLGLFSFDVGLAGARPAFHGGSSPDLEVRSGGIVEWLVGGHGSGASTAAFQLASRSGRSRGVWAIVDPARECYVPALSGWGIETSRVLVIRPNTIQEACWAIEQCLRCQGVSATWAWVDQRIPERVHRRWQMAAEVGGGVGLLFRPISARREPVWADLRLLATPQTRGPEETRRLRIDVLYRRGGKGACAQTWEIDHAAGHVRMVPEVANPTAAKRAARA
jgi:protein ImuA